MKWLVNLLTNAVVIYFLSETLDGISIVDFKISIIVAFVLALLNTLVKPILKIITIPITILTLGLSLLVLNAVIILMCGFLVTGFNIVGFSDALIFSIALSILQYIINILTK